MNTQIIAKLLRYYSIIATTAAGSGHPTSCLSAADIMAVIYFKFFKYDFENQNNIHNDRLIFSKGHAAPLLYSLYKVAGKITQEQLLSLRTIDSPFEGHPTPQTPYVDVATGSLGMGLSFGLGMALAAKIHNINNKIYILLGDGEMAEGNTWEAMAVATYYNVENIIGIIDVNRLAETGETMLGHNIDAYVSRVKSFGWDAIAIDGHDHTQITNALTKAQIQNKPTMIIAKTIKGKGISFLENKEGLHAKALKTEERDLAIQELNIAKEETTAVFQVAKPEKNLIIQAQTIKTEKAENTSIKTILEKNEVYQTRRAYGVMLAHLAEDNPDIIILDGDLSNATFSSLAQEKTPNQFFNMFIAEQNMLATAVGLSKMGKTVCVASFAAFWTRAYDQIRMAALSNAKILICGSHGGVSVGEDGASQMGLEDIAMMRAVINATIMYPADAVATVKILAQLINNNNISYIRTTRPPMPIIYAPNETFPIGGSKTLRSAPDDKCTIVAAGITVHEALKANRALKKEGINIRIIDAYSIKPIDKKTLQEAANETNKKIITVEDHYTEGGLGDAVLAALAENEVKVYKMAINEHPHSGKGEELVKKHGISAEHIIAKIKQII